MLHQHVFHMLFHLIFNTKTASLSVLTLNEAIRFTLLIMERWLIERTIIKCKDTLCVFTWFCAS